MADDQALIWQDERPSRRRKTPRHPRSGSTAAPAETPEEAPDEAPIPGGRVTLREAHHQFGVSASTLAGWARSGKVDAVKVEGRWMVTPASVAALLSQRTASRGPAPRTRASGATADGSTMLVPRDAWDKLLDQLGNLHEAGQMLADARERAAKAETEVVFLRERLSDMREERDTLKSSPAPAPAGRPRPGLLARLWDAFNR